LKKSCTTTYPSSKAHTYPRNLFFSTEFEESVENSNSLSLQPEHSPLGDASVTHPSCPYASSLKLFDGAHGITNHHDKVFFNSHAREYVPVIGIHFKKFSPSFFHGSFALRAISKGVHEGVIIGHQLCQTFNISAVYLFVELQSHHHYVERIHHISKTRKKPNINLHKKNNQRNQCCCCYSLPRKTTAVIFFTKNNDRNTLRSLHPHRFCQKRARQEEAVSIDLILIASGANRHFKKVLAEWLAIVVCKVIMSCLKARA